MDLAGDVVQALATFLNVDDLQSTADFPHEMEKLREILVKVLKNLWEMSTYDNVLKFRTLCSILFA